jgi:hypothetical protein
MMDDPEGPRAAAVCPRDQPQAVRLIPGDDVSRFWVILRVLLGLPFLIERSEHDPIASDERRHADSFLLRNEPEDECTGAFKQNAARV